MFEFNALTRLWYFVQGNPLGNLRYGCWYRGENDHFGQ